MKLSLSLLLTTCLLAGTTQAAVLLSGDSIGESNDQTISNVVITPHPVWQQPVGGAQWISFTNSGYGGTFLPNRATPQASFFETFSIAGTPLSGFLNVWADDTAAVYVNNTLVQPTGTIAFTPSTGVSLNLMPYLLTGANTIRFDLFQQGGDVSGLLYQGGYEASQVPEPGTYGLMAAGLGILGWLRRRKS